MTNRRNYNSILFLTVYLGLVLVGGGSQVFAHAATNSLFDLRNEIEFKDDLDNKPDDLCPNLTAQIDEKDKKFIADYVKLVSVSLKNHLPGIQFEIIDGVNNKDFPSLNSQLSINFFQLKSNKDGLLSKINFTTAEIKKTTHFTLAFNQILHLERNKSQNFLEKVIYENTKVLSSNNQIFIVTRLPRGSIDSLLK
ncbi:MAG TPA: hypothetical protein PKY82_16780 [Pyrinomonadaceae bacterium]|nr:hypothetical protein [Pyrinomonadaceae bacterium]